MALHYWFFITLLLLLTSCADQPSSVPGTLDATNPPAARAEPTQTFLPPGRTQTPRPSSTTVALSTQVVEPSATPYDPATLPTGEWTRLSRMRISRSEMPAVEMEGRIYVPGGVGNDFSIAQPNADSSRGFEIYDPRNDSWSRGERLPLGRHHMMVAAFNGRIYLFGGSGPCDDSPRDVCRYNGRSWSYNPTTATWSDLAPMPFRRIAGAAVTLGDFIYIVGGEAIEGNGESLSIEGSSTLLRYDPAADTWERLAMLNEPREHNVAVALDGRIYALGGRWLGDLRSVEIYDPALNSWALAAPMRKARAGFGAAVVDGRIYVAGGELIYSGDGTEIVDTVEVYDPEDNRWVERFDMPLALHGVPAVGMDGVLYLIGGSQTAGGINNRGDVWAYRP